MLTVMGRGARRTPIDGPDGHRSVAAAPRARRPSGSSAATAGVDAARLHRRTADEPWSVNDILAHVRSAADVRERFIDAMATGEHATLRYVSPRSELRKTNYVDLTFAENLAAFRSQPGGPPRPARRSSRSMPGPADR